MGVKVIIVQIEVKPGTVNDFTAATIRSLNGSMKEAGCISYEILHNDTDVNKFTLIETYKSDEAIEAHKQTEHFLKWREEVQPMMACPRVSAKHNVI